MNKRIATAVIVALFAGPFVAFAEAAVQQNSQIQSIYVQMVLLLRQIAALQHPPTASRVSITPDHGVAPLTAHFTINNPTGTESVIFGDGGYSGQTCTHKSSGWCDLSGGIAHTYQTPGAYTVTIYTHDGEPKIVATSTVIVTN